MFEGNIILELSVDIVKMDALLVRKNPKRHFFRDIGNSFHEDTHIGLEPHQIFLNISTDMVARGVGSFCTLGGAADSLIRLCQKFLCQSSIDM